MIWLNIIIGVILRLSGLGTRPFDGDEGIIIKLTQGNWGDLFSQVARDVHPPLYHILVKLTTFFGINEWSVRISSAIFGIVAIYLIYIFAKSIFSKNIALIASFFAAISPYLIYPAQEARMYTLFLVLSLGSFYFFYKLINKITTKDIIWFVICSSFMLYTHYLGFVIIGTQVFYLLFRHDQYKRIKSWLLSYIAMLVLFIPQLPTMLNQFQSRVTEQSQALSFVNNFKGLIGAFYRFGAGRLFLDLNPGSIKNLAATNIWLFLLFLVNILVPFAIFGYGKYKLYKLNRKIFWFIFVPIIIAVFLTLFSSEVGSRASRYLIYIYPFYILVISYAIGDFWKAWWGKILAIIFILINLSGIYAYFSRDVGSPGTNKIADFLSENVDENEAVLVRGGFGGGEEWALEYYLNRFKISDLRFQIFDMYGDYTAGNLDELRKIKPEDKIKELLNDYKRVWFYDMTYETDNIPDTKVHKLGYDKENKSLIIWEINNSGFFRDN